MAQIEVAPLTRSLVLKTKRVMDAGVVHLKGMTHLEVLAIINTQITDAGLAELKAALPNCDVGK
ncbi:MAG: hypothetical protein ABGZ53_29885 [Fuerstiella sp.]